MTMIEPTATYCQYAPTLYMFRALLMRAKKSAPVNVPSSVPLPPRRLVPPTTAAAMTRSS